MKRPLLYKLLAIGTLMLVLLIPLAMIGNSIEERQAYSESVIQEIARSSSYSQTLIGPVLTVPYTRIKRTWKLNQDKERIAHEEEISGELHFLPHLLRIDGDMKTELRQRGIYKAQLYQANTRIDGNFQVPANFGIEEDLQDYQFGTAYLALGVSDIRGIQNSLNLEWNKQTLSAEPGSRLAILGDGVHIKLGKLTPDQHYTFALNLLLRGTQQLSIAPLGRETHVSLSSDWPHPSFVGDFLPAERQVDQHGFSARWQTSYFSTNLAEHFRQCAARVECHSYHQARFGVSLIDPVNHYVKSDRAIKYGFLFIALTFAGFFLFEILKRLQVHPIQYGLVGLALAIFYLLLVSLSEHIGFALAYLISAIGCVSLIGFYVSHVLQSLSRAAGFTGGLALLYALLYGLLSAEDYALLMGSLLIFALLGGFMALTRRVDWYTLGAEKPTAVS